MKKSPKRKNESIKGGKPPKVKKSKGRSKKVTTKKAVKPRVDSLKPLYAFTRSKADDPQSRKIFNKKPSEFSDEDIRHLVKGVNDRLYKLEKAGLAEYSKTYQNIMKYATSGDPMYNLNIDKGTVRATQDMKRFKTDQEKYDYIRRLQEIMSNKTSTVGGTNEAIKKSYETFNKNPQLLKRVEDTDAEGNKVIHMVPLDISMEEYKKIWKAFKDNVQPDKDGKWESQTVIDFIHATREMGFYDIPEDMVGEAFRYYDQTKGQYDDMYAMLIDNPGVFSDLI